MNDNLKDKYSKRIISSMKTVLRLERARLKLHNQTISYLKTHNITFNQFKVLEVLFHKGDLNISAITKLTMSTPGNITVVIKNLNRDKWIKTLSNPNDKRESLLSITQKGAQLMEEIFPTHAQNLCDALNVLDDKELDTLHALLDKVYKAN